jgi:hypothetical protein
MIPIRYLLVLVTSLISPGRILGQDDPLIPIVDMSARVKEHRFGADGDLVEGEEDMRKIIIQWDPIPGAASYEVCQNCQVFEGSSHSGELHLISAENLRAGRPVFIKPNTPLGTNTFRVRAILEDGTDGPWSQERVFNVNEPGTAVHEEL